MPIRTTIANQSGIYFITFTCTNWLPLFQTANAWSVVYDWFDYLKKEGHYIVGFTIMPNHVHAIIAFRNTGKTINAIVSNGKRFMAYALVKALEAQQHHDILQVMAAARNATEIATQKKHKVFEPSFDWKWCNSELMIDQKLQYLHSNPCKGKWNLAASPIEYEHSSAKYYLIGEQGLYAVTHFKSIEDIDLHSNQQ
jgi:REP element-mobilizing transposase RayT